MKPIPPPWMIDDVHPQREERGDRGRVRLELPLPPPRQDPPERPPDPDAVIVIEP